VSVLAPEHPVAWTAPSPTWDDATAAGMTQPLLLRFASDRFMEEAGAVLATAPDALAGYVAVPESHRVRPPQHGDDWEPEGADAPLKLYGAAHGHFNLVAASLVCQVPGLPERTVRKAAGDEIGFVMRRLTDGDAELAWTRTAGAGAWTAAPDEGLGEGEEVLPLFPLPYSDPDGRRRTLHAGLIPVASVETFPVGGAGAPATTAGSGEAGARHGAELARLRDTWASLLARKVVAASTDHRDQARAAVDVFFVELADLLHRWHPESAARVDTDANPTATEDALVFGLRHQILPGGTTMAAMLRRAWSEQDALLGEVPGAEPTTLGLGVGGIGRDQAAAEAAELATLLSAAPRDDDAPPPASAGTGADAGAGAAQVARVAKLDPSGRARYRLRCVYRRPQCTPLHDDVLSESTDAFHLASFFDPDAPARPVHIALPFATGVKDLRKFRKSVTMALSEQLQRQMSRVGDLKQTMDGDLKQGDEIGFGLVCSFSIPIITICALIVLLIFVMLLNIVFFWLPLLRICLPVPK
jgi:hypothetical protein